ncbi:unnamed protein product [Aphanomyces euteiches]|uniref:Uncharacterized protein n=1 Tax=Aphanomyces euteiches TaxID=100861 RepID=A0A6G0WNJ6_9STRA|nr:hypothetical protein Ae201684_013249 [Aphanomyces euteiches]KAH9064901.1 hypothetical protein Ae201684P_003680 [Aphanomyces euteiches]KAH9104503.1 hypothetical protein AeMF1_019434 [Aphanomyces euteiches]KAH9130741.1 hypothetical protein LEN26_008242 [Aphanomyces euteiches]KAH9156679.1 hypothetical protein AeRB84_001414 [Aphanomyces euteiches]
MAEAAADSIRHVLSFCCGTDNTKMYLEDLLRVFDKRTVDDDMKEILQVTHPKARHLNGWHLERLALGEFGEQTPQDMKRSIHEMTNEIRSTKALVAAMLEREQMWNAKREALIADKRKQQAAMASELAIAKEIVQKMHDVVDELEEHDRPLSKLNNQTDANDDDAASQPRLEDDSNSPHVLDLSHAETI